MRANLPGRLKNTQLSPLKALWPLFECVVNSIHSIEDSKRKDGEIRIEVVRDDAQGQIQASSSREQFPVLGFRVVDNGVGFDDENFASFEETDSGRKAKRGGKGIGRLMWLKAFESARVSSVCSTGTALRKREFRFRPTIQGIEDLVDVVTSAEPNLTSVELLSYKEQYQNHCPRSLDALAEKLLDHLLLYFVRNLAPTIWISESSGGDARKVNEIYKRDYSDRSRNADLVVGGIKFNLVTVLRNSATRQSQVLLCAHDREVIQRGIDKIVPEFPHPIRQAEGKDRSCSVYVCSEYLDNNSNDGRTAFAFSDGTQSSTLDTVSEAELMGGIAQSVREQFKSELDVSNRSHREFVETTVNAKLPTYRYLLHDRHANLIKRIPRNISEDQLDIELYKVQRDVSLKIREQREQMESVSPSSESDYQELIERYELLIEEENGVAKASLASYIVHRKAIVELFERALELTETGKYKLESEIHELICPLRSTSNDQEWLDRQNLWMIDERLTYHLYVASDKPLSTSVSGLKSAKEPDILIFNDPHVFAEDRDQIQTGVIIEFKRPGGGHSKAKDPLTQALDYIEKIKSGKTKTNKGALLRISDVPFHVYVVSELTPDVERAAKTMNLTKSLDNNGFYGYNPNYSAYIEVISLRKLLFDAKRRNRILFDKLNLATT
jgi:hypothetical protein